MLALNLENILDDHNTFNDIKQKIDEILLCPITKKKLNNPLLLKIQVENEDALYLTVDESALDRKPADFRANRPAQDLINYNGKSYLVMPCFNVKVNELLDTLYLCKNETMRQNEIVITDEAKFKNSLEKVLQCPITHDLLKAPVITNSGYSYSCDALLASQGRRICPITQKATEYVYPNILLKDVLEIYLKYSGENAPQDYSQLNNTQYQIRYSENEEDDERDDFDGVNFTLQILLGALGVGAVGWYLESEAHSILLAILFACIIIFCGNACAPDLNLVIGRCCAIGHFGFFSHNQQVENVQEVELNEAVAEPLLAV